jgi:hypothetical protein
MQDVDLGIDWGIHEYSVDDSDFEGSFVRGRSPVNFDNSLDDRFTIVDYPTMEGPLSQLARENDLEMEHAVTHLAPVPTKVLPSSLLLIPLPNMCMTSST